MYTIGDRQLSTRKFRKVVSISPDHIDTNLDRLQLESEGTLCRECREDYTFRLKSKETKVGDLVPYYL